MSSTLTTPGTTGGTGDTASMTGGTMSATSASATTTATYGTTPTGTMPTSVPTFTPRSSWCSNTADAAIRPWVKQTDHSTFPSNAYDSLQAAAVKGLTVTQNTKTNKKVTIDPNIKKRLDKIQSYPEACTHQNCEKNETRALVGRYKPVLLTKLRKS